ncbi:hypothetical protein M408DRAFT_276752 [Serendipita vermifera MAFF 305830]|uniref:Protein kinase domain-containing protein n=1 Tax=Serendipita vermifera MAFF 305830 TaxID=933852 RepID=A0A0C3AUB8_SERVB|nr:hypothetical protein M408DRAFT_276752 [Serendipita vermifera MAFF 305830]
MAPSYFARSAGWALAQLGPAPIHCLRPADCSGLPISLLNPAFSNFKFILAQPMPSNSDATRAMAVAWNLCMTMPKHFKNDTLRKEALFTRLRGLFCGRGFTTTSFGSASPAGALLRFDGSIDVVVELKNEPGAAGDVYMQCASSFEAAAIHQLKNQGSAECAAFVVSVDGPNLLICGGFKDDGVSVVEPLSHWCSMLPDGLGERQEVLAKHLYALHASLDQLKAPARGKVSKCPRIYDSFQTIDAKTRPLEFISPYKPRGSHCLLLFKAKAAIIDEPEEVLVKVVRGRYGEHAHRAAAQQGFAPKLYGVAEVNGAPTAYVMEFFSKEEGWMPLQYTSLQSQEQWKLLEAQSVKFLTFMRKNRLVHGDLRPNNILLRVKDSSVELRILDWDWAGEFGSARYPLNLNQEAKLPGDAGELITEEDDCVTMTDWLKKVRDPSFGLLY